MDFKILDFKTSQVTGKVKAKHIEPFRYFPFFSLLFLFRIKKNTEGGILINEKGLYICTALKEKQNRSIAQLVRVSP